MTAKGNAGATPSEQTGGVREGSMGPVDSRADAPSQTLEREVKLGVSLDFAVPDIEGIAGTTRLPPQELRAVYFDTGDLRLWGRGITLRHRSGDRPGEGIWTLKLPEGTTGLTLDRTELAWMGGRNTLPGEAVRILQGIVRDAVLEPVAVLDTVRYRLLLHDSQGVPYGELSDDTVTVSRERTEEPEGSRAGERETVETVRQPGEGMQANRFRQLELELSTDREGSMEQVVDLLHRAGAVPDGQPKLLKAFEILDRHPASVPTASRSSTVADVIQVAVASGLVRLLDHDYRLRLVRGRPQAEDVHQARVATRRLRSDLRLLAGELDPVWTRITRGELQWLGELFGAVRDIDVLATTILGEPEESEEWATQPGTDESGGSTGSSGPPGLSGSGRAELRAALDEERRGAARHMAEALESERYVSLLDRLHAAITLPPIVRSNKKEKGSSNKKEKGSKRRGSIGRGPDAPARLVLPGLIRKQVRRLRREVRDGGRNPSDVQLHMVRIGAKRVRYASELAEPVLGKAARRLASRAADLQGVLGDHHDAVVAEQWLSDRMAQATNGARSSVEFAVAEARRRQEELRAQWPAAWKALDRKKLWRRLG